MDWGLLAGGVSKGINDAFSGANQGLVQGEGIRAGRASEALQGQHLGLQQQTLQSHLAQQQVQNQLARDQLGLHRDQLAQSKAYHDSVLGIHGGELALKGAKLPYEIDETKAKTGYYNYRPKYMSDSLDIRRDANEMKLQRINDQHEDAQARLAYLDKSLQQRAARGIPVTPQDRADTLELRDLRQSLALTSRFMEFNPGQPLPKGYDTVPNIRAKIMAIEQDFRNRANTATPGFTPPAQPGQMSFQDMMKELGLK